ncbi:MAG: AtpZ/AtpI family protein [Alphaproteobacteria bacterium]|nr:AtpZ/AtpI family protein [Alphaproteobacteria bacterium]
MDEREARASLKDLGERLAKARGTLPRRPPPGGGASAQNALAFGLRIGVELVVAVVVSVGIGWAIDAWLGTKPAAMVVMFFLGVAAGMWNVYRAVAGMGMRVGARGGKAGVRGDDEDED